MSDRRTATKTFHYAGLDLVLTPEGFWVLVEVNDHPIGLIEADEISRPHGDQAVFAGSGVDYLSRILVEEAGSLPVCMVLPDCFRVAMTSRVAHSVRLRHGQIYDDLRISGTLKEFNSISSAIRLLGGVAQITDITGLKLSKRQVYLFASGRAGALFRKASNFPEQEPLCFCMNDLRLRSLCANKFSSDAVLRKALGEQELPSVFPPNMGGGGPSSPNSIDPGQFVILKPVWGSASMGIQRIQMGELQRALEVRSPQDCPLLCQRWVEPSSVHCDRGDYYYDVRVYVVGGEPVAGYARRSAAPHSGAEPHSGLVRNSPLSWLTTTGPRLPLLRRGGDGGVHLSRDQIEALYSLSRRATSAMDDAASRVNYERAFMEIPNFTSLAGIKGNMSIIYLEDNHSSLI